MIEAGVCVLCVCGRRLIEASWMLGSLPRISSSFYPMVSLAYLEKNSDRKKLAKGWCAAYKKNLGIDTPFPRSCHIICFSQLIFYYYFNNTFYYSWRRWQMLGFSINLPDFTRRQDYMFNGSCSHQKSFSCKHFFTLFLNMCLSLYQHYHKGWLINANFIFHSSICNYDLVITTKCMLWIIVFSSYKRSNTGYDR